MIERGPEQVKALLREVQAARSEFIAALADVEPSLLTAPGLVGQWSARELIAHLGYWTGHAAEAIHHAEMGRAADFGEDEHDVDERNAIVARVAAETDLATVRQREEAAFEALVTRLERADPPGWTRRCPTATRWSASSRMTVRSITANTRSTCAPGSRADDEA